MTNPDEIRLRFEEFFRGNPVLFRAPGRANIIGEHTDYNQGLVLPAAVNFYCWAAAAPRSDNRVVIHSKNKEESAEAELASLQPSGRWSDYPFGVAWKLQQAGYVLAGANLYIDSDVPLGAGLSSSAAIEVATALALAQIAGLSLQPESTALLCQAAENEFVGTRCGVMDQFTSCLGKAGKALFLDCRSLSHELIPVPLEISFVVCNTMIKHELSAGEYNLRRRECEQGVKALQEVLAAVSSLRDVTPDQLESNRHLLSPNIYKRCRHVISENARVCQMVTALQSADTLSLSGLMAESHKSLRDDFQVSTPELDLMVDLAQGVRGFLGGRMMGGGFGGCTINLVDRNHASQFAKSIARRYESAAQVVPDTYICEAAEGAGRLLTDSTASAPAAASEQAGHR